MAELFGQVCLLLSWTVPLGEGAAGPYPLELGGNQFVYCQLNSKFRGLCGFMENMGCV